MATYLVMYQNTATGIIKASSKEQALNEFVLYVNSHKLEKKHDYGEVLVHSFMTKKKLLQANLKSFWIVTT